jgi:hypothetical protein
MAVIDFGEFLVFNKLIKKLKKYCPTTPELPINKILLFLK